MDSQCCDGAHAKTITSGSGGNTHSVNGRVGKGMGVDTHDPAAAGVPVPELWC